MVGNILRTVLVDVVLPIAAYVGLVSRGLASVWALAASAGVSVVVLAVGSARTRVVSTLGVLVLVRFVLGLLLALLTLIAVTQVRAGRTTVAPPTR